MQEKCRLRNYFLLFYYNLNSLVKMIYACAITFDWLSIFPINFYERNQWNYNLLLEVINDLVTFVFYKQNLPYTRHYLNLGFIENL